MCDVAFLERISEVPPRRPGYARPGRAPTPKVPTMVSVDKITPTAAKPVISVNDDIDETTEEPKASAQVP